MPEGIEEILQELVDREKIREVVHRYCWAVDRGTLEEIMEFFDDDSCDLALGSGQRYTGKATVQSWYERFIQNREVLRHFIHNQIITIEGDQAFSKCYFEATGEVQGESIVVRGIYEDTLLRVRRKWKFVEKVITMDSSDPHEENRKKSLRAAQPPSRLGTFATLLAWILPS